MDDTSGRVNAMMKYLRMNILQMQPGRDLVPLAEQVSTPLGYNCKDDVTSLTSLYLGGFLGGFCLHELKLMRPAEIIVVHPEFF